MQGVTLIVSMAEMKFSRAPDQLVTLGLGSCIGVCMHEPLLKIGGLAHVMLPEDSLAIDKSNKAKFANTAVPLLIEELVKMGANSERLVVKMVGGAHMFSFGKNDNSLNVGSRNQMAIENMCKKYGIHIIGKSIGGNAGKSITFDLETGNVRVRSLNANICII